MSIRTLKFLRLLIPGLMILVIILTIQNNDLVALSKALQGLDLSKQNFQFYIIPIVLGALYYALRFRSVFFKQPIETIQKNIRERLVSEFDNDPDVSPYSDRLKGDRKIIQVFYKFIDSNPSLTEKSNNVRANGLLLSSFADACVISLFALVLYFALLLFSFSHYYLLLLILSALAFASCFFLMLPSTTKLHLDYSNSQIDFIITNLHDELKKALIKVVESRYAD
jgi:hypothetical protein